MAEGILILVLVKAIALKMSMLKLSKTGNANWGGKIYRSIYLYEPELPVGCPSTPVTGPIERHRSADFRACGTCSAVRGSWQ